AEKLIDNLDKSVKAIKENHLVNNSDYTLTEEIVCASKCRAKRVVGFEKQRAKLRYSPFLVVEELEKVQQELKNLHFETKIKVDIKFGYVASQNSQIRYQSLCNLEKNNGLTVVQCLANLTTQPISKKLINGLNLIAKYDIDQKVAGKANELVEMYRLTEELNPGKKLESGKY
ncbi:hypothetical protein HON01_01600, partial [Candidatus Woesearchaeota archaeon]|nr:hypothetical protein [Candidatus Woesearchaeota archaeon]